MANFNDFYKKSKMADILKKAKTLSAVECRAVFKYMKTYKPKTILEFGVQYGCSTRMFIEIAKSLGYKLNLHSWDIEEGYRFVKSNQFTFHKEDITGREKKIIEEYKPNLIFLDAHPYNLTKNLMELCVDKKINFMAHDISLLERCRKQTGGFKNKKVVQTPWEAYLIGKVIDESLWTKDLFENDKLIARCIRDKFGLAIVEHKK